MSYTNYDLHGPMTTTTAANRWRSIIITINKFNGIGGSVTLIRFFMGCPRELAEITL